VQLWSGATTSTISTGSSTCVPEYETKSPAALDVDLFDRYSTNVQYVCHICHTICCIPYFRTFMCSNAKQEYIPANACTVFGTIRVDVLEYYRYLVVSYYQILYKNSTTGGATEFCACARSVLTTGIVCMEYQVVQQLVQSTTGSEYGSTEIHFIPTRET
jgi:hypothetical protein